MRLGDDHAVGKRRAKQFNEALNQANSDNDLQEANDDDASSPKTTPQRKAIGGLPTTQSLDTGPKFTDEQIYGATDAASKKMEGAQQGEKVARRHEIWAKNFDPHFVETVLLNNAGFRRQLASLDLHWDADKKEFVLDPMVEAKEQKLRQDPGALKAENDRIQEIEHAPEEESTFHKLFGGESFICKHTVCGSIMDQYHADIARGMSPDDAKARGILFGVLPLALPSKSGPGDLIIIEGTPRLPAPVIPAEPPVVAKPPVQSPPAPATPTSAPKPSITAHADQGGVVLNEVKPADVTPVRPSTPAAKPVAVETTPPPTGQRRYVPAPKPQPKPKETTTPPPEVEPPQVSGTKRPTPMRVKPDPATARPTGPASEHDADILSQPGSYRQNRAYPSAHQHHIFPQELRAWFAERFNGSKENIDEYTVYLSEGEHTAIHSRGEGGTVKGVQEADLKGWNREWKDFMTKNPKATAQQIFEEAGHLMEKYKISEAEITRYGTKKK
jgi:hypothetical protein